MTMGEDRWRWTHQAMVLYPLSLFEHNLRGKGQGTREQAVLSTTV